MKRLVLLVALLLLAGCGSGNIVGPSAHENVPSVKDGKAANLIPPTKLDHWWDGEPDEIDPAPGSDP